MITINFELNFRKFCPTRPERAEAPSPGRALKKSPFLRTKTEKGYDL